jgi:hypothetical protein
LPLTTPPMGGVAILDRTTSSASYHAGMHGLLNPSLLCISGSDIRWSGFDLGSMMREVKRAQEGAIAEMEPCGAKRTEWIRVPNFQGLA